MPVETPRLALMGHPNAGKSSVVATLTENDRIVIDKRAGTTTESDLYPVVIDGQAVIEFIDTPGFQNPGAILEWFQAHEGSADLPRAFVEAHRGEPLFVHDCALLEPVADGAGIILVVDGSRRIKEKDRIEIELLRLTARPRMAILNNLTSQNKFMEQWRDTLGMAFNSVREFNAHRATYAERIRLLHALKSIDQRWESRLELTVDAFERDWDRRLDQVTETLLELLRQALTFRVTRTVKTNHLVFQSDRDRIRAEIMAEFAAGLRQLETRAQARIRTHFRHSVWNVSGSSVLAKDLLSEEVSRALGLSRRQLAMVGVAAGAATGAGLDLALLGHSLGLGTLFGAAAGGFLGVAGGGALAKLDIEEKPGTQRFSVGPVSNGKFPFVLLDRGILYSARAMNWSHGRQAAAEEAPNRVPDREIRIQGFTEALPAPQQRDLARFFTAARRGRDPDQEAACRDIIKGVLRDLSESRIDSRAGL
jgi:hypothetical protein